MEAVLQTQSLQVLEVVGWPVEDSMTRVFIRDKAPISECKTFIATVSRDSLSLEDWCEETSVFSRSLEKKNVCFSFLAKRETKRPAGPFY